MYTLSLRRCNYVFHTMTRGKRRRLQKKEPLLLLKRRLPLKKELLNPLLQLKINQLPRPMKERLCFQEVEEWSKWIKHVVADLLRNLKYVLFSKKIAHMK